MYSERFEKALKHTLRWEGGYVNDPDDPGGATKNGISLRFLKAVGEIEDYDYDGDGDIDAKDIAKLSAAQIKGLYSMHFWVDEFDDIKYDFLAIKLFDVFVNVGEKQGVKLLQRTLNRCTPWAEKLVVDGAFGPKTIRELRLCSSLLYHADRVMHELQAQLCKFYFGLADRRPASRKFLFGWLRRTYDVPKRAENLK